MFGPPVPIPYVKHRCSRILRTGYLIMDYIEQDNSKMLSDSWEDKRDEKARRSNLFRGLSRITLSLARVPLQRIGSFTIDDGGVMSLANRPLTLRLHQLENEGIPIDIARQDTYTTQRSSHTYKIFYLITTVDCCISLTQLTTRRMPELKWLR